MQTVSDVYISIGWEILWLRYIFWLLYILWCVIHATGSVWWFVFILVYLKGAEAFLFNLNLICSPVRGGP